MGSVPVGAGKRKERFSRAVWICAGASLETERPEVRAAARIAGTGARRQAVFLKTEAGAVKGLTSTEDTRVNVLTKTGSGSGRARSDRSRALGGVDIEAGEVGE